MEEYKNYKNEIVNKKLKTLKDDDIENRERISWLNQQYENLTAAEKRGISN